MKKIFYFLFILVFFVNNYVFSNTKLISISQSEDESEYRQESVNAENPNRNASGHFSAGKRALQNNELDKAYDQFKKAIALNPENAGYYYLLGVSALNLHKYKEARDAFRKAKSLDPDLKFTKDKNVFEERLRIASEKSGERFEAQREGREEREQYREEEQRETKTPLGTKIGIILLIIAGILLVYYIIKKKKKNY